VNRDAGFDRVGRGSVENTTRRAARRESAEAIIDQGHESDLLEVGSEPVIAAGTNRWFPSSAVTLS
jgi:hypothetical protein